MKEADFHARDELFQKFLLESKPYQNSVKNSVFSVVKNSESREDVMQSVLLKTWQHAEDIYTEKYTPGGRRGWFFRLARNESINYARSEAVREKGSIINQDKIRSNIRTPEQLAIAHEDQKIFLQSINKLDDVLRPVASLFIQGYSIQEISEKLDIPIGTVFSRNHRAKQQLKKRKIPA